MFQREKLSAEIADRCAELEIGLLLRRQHPVL
jgi:hypothetical protein